MTADRLPRTIRSIDPSRGLHRLKGDFQKQFMAIQCRQLVQGLDEAIEATRAAAPVRTRPYLPKRPGYVSKSFGKETIIERAMHKQWSTSDADPAAGCWQSIEAFQVNLPNKRIRGDGWGEIDLLGLAEDGLPIVIEVKSGSSAESPAQLLVQAAAYGIALQKAWSDRLKTDWQEVVIRRLGNGHRLPPSLSPCRLVCVAPEKYWEQWRRSNPKTWASFIDLVGAFASRGLPATFVSLESIYRPFVLELGKWTARR